MYLLLVFLVFLCVFLWIRVHWLKVKNYWAERNVPYSPPHFILGNLKFMLRDNPAIWMRKTYEEFQSPYVGAWLFWRPALIVNSPEIAKNILVKDSNLFKNRFASSGKNDPTGSLNLFTVKDPMWTNIRRRLSPVFTVAKIRAMQNVPLNKSNNLIQRIKIAREEKLPVDLRAFFADYSTDVIGEAAFGVSCNATLTGDSPIKMLTEEFMKYDFFRGIAWCSIFFFPKLVDYFGFTLFPKNTTNHLRKVFRAMVQLRGGYDNENLKNKDLLDALIKLKQQAAKEGEVIDEDVLIAQAAAFVQGGFDTTASILTFATYELAFNPYFQNKLYEELKVAKEECLGGDFETDVLSRLKFLDAVVKETMRKYPTLGWLDRIASENYQIDDKLTISAGTVIYVNAVGMHYDPVFYPNPETFDPERFLPGNEGNLTPYTFMPFGEGPRRCIGMFFGYQTVKFGLSQMIYNFELRPLPGAPKPNECHIESKGLLLTPDQIMSLEFVPRH